MPHITDTVQFTLSQDEVQVFDYLCREAGEDPQEYRTGQQVEAGPTMYRDLAFEMAQLGSARLDEDGGIDDIATSITETLELCDDIFLKFGRALQDAALAEATNRMMGRDERIPEDVLRAAEADHHLHLDE